jgi:hypothetical protein
VRQSVVNLIRGAVVKRGVTALVIVKAYPLLQAVAQLGATAEGMQVKVIVFDGPQQPFNEDVVLASAAAVHTDGDPVVLEDLSKTVAGELCSLVGVEDLRFSITIQGFLEGLITEIRVQGIGKPLGQDFAAMPVHDRHQVHKATGHGNVGDIGSPNLIGMIDPQVSEQIEGEVGDVPYYII